MSDALTLGFGPFAAPAKDVLIVFCDQGLNFGPATRKALGPAAASGGAGGQGRALCRQERVHA